MPTPTDCRRCGRPYYGAAGLLCRECEREAKRPSDAAACSPSDTPETDAATDLIKIGLNEYPMVDAEVSRKLERERNQEMGYRSQWCDKARKLECKLNAALGPSDATACSACGQVPRRTADYGDLTEYEVRCLVAEYCMSVTLGATGWGVPFKVWVELHGVARHDKMHRLIRLPNVDVLASADEKTPTTKTND